MLLVVLGLAAIGSPANAPGPPQPGPWQQIDIAKDWRFKLDTGDAGAPEGWAASSYDDRGWVRIDAGKPWDDQGYPNYSGIAWYRRTVDLPPGWRGQPLYLWLPGIDDEGDVFVDGRLVGHFGDRATNNSVRRDQLPIDIGNVARAGSVATIAIRVNNWGGSGGMSENLPTAIATSGTALFTNDRYVKYWFQQRPDLPWPYWLSANKGAVKQQGAAWSMVGTEGSAAKALIGLDSSVMPNQDGVAITPWLFDRETNLLYTPQPPGTAEGAVSVAPTDDYLPLPTAQWSPPGLKVDSKLFVADVSDGVSVRTPAIGSTAGAVSGTGDVVAGYILSVMNDGPSRRDLTLLLALRPFSVAGRLERINSLSLAGSAVLVNGLVGVLPDRPAEGFGAMSSESGDVGMFAREGLLPKSQSASDPRGLASGALSYHLTLDPGQQATLSFKLPVLPRDDEAWLSQLQALDTVALADQTAQAWGRRLGDVQLSLPDARYSSAYYASLANLFMAANGDLLMPGPLAHRHFWYRDAAFVSLALLRAGRADLVKPLLDKAAAGQLPSGEFPAILEADGKPAAEGKREWDAQGEGIFTFVSYYRSTSDRAWLAQVYPTIARAAGFLQALRRSSEQPALVGTPAYGILPPSESAEDLGPGDWHHYWDDFWGLAGLKEASYAANELGKLEEAKLWQDEEVKLRSALLTSISILQAAKGIDFVPNGPEDTDSSSMARGTTPAIWPYASFDVGDPLMRRSFDVYYQRWVAPFGGAYRHQGDANWPYAGLELAHAYLLLGQSDKTETMLNWALNNQTFPGLYAWAESVLPKDNRFAGGDMPHAWAAAEYTMLIRDMLVREEGDQLVIGDYLPRSWLTDGQRVAVDGLPTAFGTAGYMLQSHANAGYWDLTINDEMKPTGGFVWRVPAGMTVQRVEIDGREWTDFDASGIRLPVGTHSARLYGRLPSP